jgi:ABC-type ATPase with predicted acetyltransferase domain
LSEAFAFVKPYRLLSRGQRYRAMLADLLLRSDPVWLIDEFCADLDPMAARIVAHNLRKNVMRTGRIAFVAAANHAHFLDALRPTQVINLRLGGGATFSNFKDYRDEFLVNTG